MFSRFFSLCPLFAVFLSLMQPVYAQEAYVLDVRVPQEVELKDEVRVVLELTDQEGNPVEGSDPEISFDPGSAVAQELLYDCGDPEWYDGCAVNHRAVPGIFEVSYIQMEDQVHIAVDVAGLQESVNVRVAESEAVIPLAQAAEAPAEPEAVVPEDVQVGPQPSFWFLILPFVALCTIVTIFVLSTTE